MRAPGVVGILPPSNVCPRETDGSETETPATPVRKEKPRPVVGGTPYEDPAVRKGDTAQEVSAAKAMVRTKEPAFDLQSFDFFAY